MKENYLFITCLVAAFLFSSTLWAKEDYAVVKDGTITFYYDNNKDSRNGTVYDFTKELANGLPKWADGNLRTAIFDESFSDYRPNSTYGLFGNCTGLIEIQGLSNLNTSEVTNMNQMFAQCSSLEKLDLKGINTENVTSMDWMFFRCQKLTKLDLSSFDTKHVESMSQMFANCTNIKEIDVSSFNTSSVKNMYKAFSACGNLETIFAGDGWTTLNVTNGANMFDSCFKLVGGNGTKCDGWGVTTPIDYTYARIDTDATPGFFSYKTPSKVEAYVVVNGGVLTFYYDENRASRSGNVYDIAAEYKGDGNFPAWQSSEITKVIFDNSFSDYMPLSTARWFHSCSGITEIEGIANLNSRDVTNMGGMFYGCSSIKRLDLDHLNTGNVTNMYAMFYGCSSLESLDLSNFDTGLVTSMVAMFYNCTSLKILNMSGFITKNMEDMQYMFFNCSSLTTLDLSSFNTSKVTNMDAMFANCSSIVTIYAGDEWSTGNVTSGDYTFYDCNNLVGGNGTTYGVITNYLYAKVDESDSPGYLTLKKGVGISDIDNNSTDGRIHWFTIGGTRHLTPRNGLYIRNKKKVIVK